MKSASVTLPMLTLALLLAVGTPAGSAYAEEASPDTATEADTQDSGDDEASEEQKTPDKPSADVFIPTEEISEDFAVSFPVDI